MRSRSTPGALGYVVAVAVSIVVTALGIAVVTLAEEGPVQGFEAFVVCLVYVTLFAMPCALVGVPLVHLLCRRARAQWVHVLVAGLAGALAGLAFGLLIRFGTGLVGASWLTALLAVATATGRASVIGLVPGVRAGRRPVDDDFRPEPAAR